jgi:uncharacterized membrane protein YphA (DoxX/SURF4 family)
MGIKRTAPMRTWVFHISRLLLGAVFIYASIHKIIDPKGFALAVYNYQILHDELINLAALTLPWLELLVGLCLVAGIWLPGSTAISSGLFALFVFALSYNQMRGLDISCGCFSTDATEGPADLWTVLSDILFLALSLYVTVYVFFLKTRNLKQFNSK